MTGVLVEFDEPAADQRLVAARRQAGVNMAAGHRRRRPVVVGVRVGKARRADLGLPYQRAGRGVSRIQIASARHIDGAGARHRVWLDGGGRGDPARRAAHVRLGVELAAPHHRTRRLAQRVEPAAFSADIYPASRHGRAGLQAGRRLARHGRRLPVPHLAGRSRVGWGERRCQAHRTVLRPLQVLPPVKSRPSRRGRRRWPGNRGRRRQQQASQSEHHEQGTEPHKTGRLVHCASPSALIRPDSARVSARRPDGATVPPVSIM